MSPFRRVSLLAASSALVFGMADRVPVAAQALRVVALEGQGAPETTERFGEFFAPSVNREGDVSFVGAYVGIWGGWGIYNRSASALDLIHRNLTHPPGFPTDSRFTGLTVENPINSQRTVAYSAYIDGSDVLDSIWTAHASGESFVATTSMNVPGLPTGNHFWSLDAPRQNDSADLLFQARLDVAGPNVEPTNDSGLWLRRNGATSLLARESAPAPGLASGYVFDDIRADQARSNGSLALNGQGQVAMRADAYRAGSPDVTGVWMGQSGSLQLVAATGQSIPGAPGVTMMSINDLDFNDAGAVAFHAGLNQGSWSGALVAGGPGQLRTVAKYAAPAAGLPASVLFDSFSPAALDDASRVSFAATLDGAGVNNDNDSGIWTETAPGVLNMLAREGQPAPGTSSVFNDLWNISGNGDAYGTLRNGDGRVAFMSRLRGPGVNSDNEMGIWAQDAIGVLRMVAREGQSVDLGNGDSGIIWGLTTNDLIFNGAGGDGRAASFSDRGTLVFRAFLTDHRYVLLEYLPPTPGDATGDGHVTGADFTVWADNFGHFSGDAQITDGDFNGDGRVTGGDFTIWADHFGQSGFAAPAISVPEPSALPLVLVALPAVLLRPWFKRSCAGCLAIALALASTRQTAAQTLRPIALSGQAAPATLEEFGGFWLPSVNRDGDVAFVTQLDDVVGGWGMYTRTNNGLDLVHLNFTQPPGYPSGSFFNGLTDPNPINAAQRVAFSAFVNGNGVPNSVWTAGAGGESAVATALVDVPGLPSGNRFSQFDPPRLNSQGHVAVQGRLAHLGLGVTQVNDTGMWVHRGGATQLLALESMPAPGLANGYTFGDFHSEYTFGHKLVALNDAGASAFWAIADRADHPQLEGVWVGEPGAVQLVAAEGQSAPGLPGSTLTGIIEGTLDFNNRGDVAFMASLAGSDGGGLFAGQPGQLRNVARSDAVVPGLPATTFGHFSPASLDESGAVSFAATLRGSGVTGINDSGIWVESSPGNVELLVREGEAAPGTSLVFDDLWNMTGAGDVFGTVRNGAGQIAFMSRVRGPDVTLDNQVGIWAQDSIGVLRLVAREGQTVDLGGGDSAVIWSLTSNDLVFNGAGGDGRAASFSDRGTMVFRARLTDQRYVLLEYVPPTPGDATGDDHVTGADFTVWADNFGLFSGDAQISDGDFNGDGRVTGGDFTIWADHFGQSGFAASVHSVPEPAGLALMAVGASLLATNFRRKREPSQ